MISMVSLVNRDINLVSGIRRVNVNTMIGMVIRVNKMGSNVNTVMKRLVWLAG